jgi:hypothetical protein
MRVSFRAAHISKWWGSLLRRFSHLAHVMGETGIPCEAKIVVASHLAVKRSVVYPFEL